MLRFRGGGKIASRRPALFAAGCLFFVRGRIAPGWRFKKLPNGSKNDHLISLSVGRFFIRWKQKTCAEESEVNASFVRLKVRDSHAKEIISGSASQNDVVDRGEMW
jgi:hypothetical protein